MTLRLMMSFVHPIVLPSLTDLRPARAVRWCCPQRHKKVARRRNQARARGHARGAGCSRGRGMLPELVVTPLFHSSQHSWRSTIMYISQSGSLQHLLTQQYTNRNRKHAFVPVVLPLLLSHLSNKCTVVLSVRYCTYQVHFCQGKSFEHFPLNTAVHIVAE